MIYCYEEPDMVHVLLEKATQFITEYCLSLIHIYSALFFSTRASSS